MDILEKLHNVCVDAYMTEDQWKIIEEAKAEIVKLRACARRLEKCATDLSNHDRIKKPPRSQSDWSRLHTAIDIMREALPHQEDEE